MKECSPTFKLFVYSEYMNCLLLAAIGGPALGQPTPLWVVIGDFRQLLLFHDWCGKEGLESGF